MSTRGLPRRLRQGNRTLFGAFVLAVVGLVLVILAATGAFNSSSNNVGTVSAGAAPATSTGTGAAPASQQDPFGKPGGASFRVPPPSGEPNLVSTYATKTTTRLYGGNPYQEGVSITQHIWPAALPL